MFGNMGKMSMDMDMRMPDFGAGFGNMEKLFNSRFPEGGRMTQSMISKGNPTHMMRRKHVTKSYLDKNGQRKTESYFNNNMRTRKNNNTISEEFEGYRDANGHEQIKQERRLNGKGMNVVKSR